MTDGQEPDDGLFRLPARTITIELDGDFKGAWIRCVRRMNLADYLRLAKRKMDDTETIARWFAKEAIVDWNLSDETGKVAVSEEAFMTIIPTDLAMQIINGFIEAVGAVPAPLGSASPDGGTSGAELTKTAKRSRSRPNSRKQK